MRINTAMLRLAASRALLAGLGWWVISEGQVAALPAGAAAVVLAVGLSLILAPRIQYRVRPWGLLLFLGYFLGHSLLAGLDVARRILHPAMPITPVIERVPLSLDSGPQRWLLANVLSLLPGTLSVAFEGDMLLLHCLSHSDDRVKDVRAVEHRVARVFAPARGAA